MIQATIDHDDVKEDSFVTERSKIAISSGYLLASIIGGYFDKHKCEYMTDDEHKELVESILDNLFVVGGACRSLLLSQPINDLDIQCNTRYNKSLQLWPFNSKYISKSKAMCYVQQKQ